MTTSIENKLARKRLEMERIIRALALAVAEKDVLAAYVRQEKAGER